MSINGAPIMMEVDTGATPSIISYSTFLASWPKRHQPELKSLEAKLQTYTVEEIAVTGASDVTVKYHNQEVNLLIMVVGGDGPTLLGRDRLQHLRLDWAALNHIAQTKHCELEKLLSDHSALFSEGLGESRPNSN